MYCTLNYYSMAIFSTHNPLLKYLCVILSVLPKDASLQTKSKVIQKDSAFITVKENIKSHQGHQKNQLKPVKLIKYTKCEKIHKNMLVITAFKNTVSTGMFKLITKYIYYPIICPEDNVIMESY